MWTSVQLQNPVGIINSEINLQEYGLEGYIDLNNPEEGERPIFQPISQLIDEHWQQTLNDELNRTDENFGINDYIKCLEIITRN